MGEGLGSSETPDFASLAILSTKPLFFISSRHSRKRAVRRRREIILPPTRTRPTPNRLLNQRRGWRCLPVGLQATSDPPEPTSPAAAQNWTRHSSRSPIRTDRLISVPHCSSTVAPKIRRTTRRSTTSLRLSCATLRSLPGGRTCFLQN
jgi:hypothetical protein